MVTGPWVDASSTTANVHLLPKLSPTHISLSAKSNICELIALKLLFLLKTAWQYDLIFLSEKGCSDIVFVDLLIVAPAVGPV